MTTAMEAPAPQKSLPPTPGNDPKHWLADSQNRLTAGVGMLVVVAAVGWFVIVSGQRKEEFAARALNRARDAAESGNLPLAASELQKVIASFRGTDAAVEAVITLNQVRMVNGQTELAVVGLRDYLKSGPERKYLAPAYGLLGAALENSNQPGQAAQAFLSAADAADVDYLKAEYLNQAGRAWVNAGKPEEAIKAYQRVVTEFPKAPG
ncbi:MAG: tetratricopeptide repeat protein, partial [Gemmatimonadales bacterium]